MNAGLVVVDGANVVGSVPDGWWRDRRAAAVRLRDRLADYAEDHPEAEVVLVLEGAARGVASVPGVRVSEAPTDGDSHIVAVVAESAEPCVVVTADRELRGRVESLGATCVGPRTVYP
ncbi:NTP pyrophosphohydrolase [Streptomyces sp. NBC_00006]|uniref:NTP pyrophosphohydrolase n=1 Tax=unclassified Streptomyces TaxID=2593676 RepID=UPI00225B8370|nr:MULTISPECIES: NTP pyrophosphohydrolase [unclassified Streptomyces]MCX4830026.1 NTP pyrophosphohydrolase [Streptomyces sp. NBC_01016]MCX5530645.1 NTP pyrophosphohydrolase [Streptomyces sp. NBC_00006]